ncbi:MAG TPA: DUF3341 domain-containing protein [Thermodesulfobacteriota bacterium]
MHTGLLGEFASPEAMLQAVRRLRGLGYERLDTFSPHPVPGASRALGLPRSRLPRAVLVWGLVGAASGYLIQWWPNAVDYPLNVGGRPAHAVPAFVPITFELGILFAAFAALVTLLLRAGLPALWRPVFEAEGFERASIDRYFVGIDDADPRFDHERSARDLLEAGAARVVRTG